MVSRRKDLLALALSSTTLAACAHAAVDPPPPMGTSVDGAAVVVIVRADRDGESRFRLPPFSNFVSPCFPISPLVCLSALFADLDEALPTGLDEMGPRRPSIARELLDPDNPDEGPPAMGPRAHVRIRSITSVGPGSIDAEALARRLDPIEAALGRCVDWDRISTPSRHATLGLRYDHGGDLLGMDVVGIMSPRVRACVEEELAVAVSPVATPSLSVRISVRITRWMTYE